MKSPGQRLIILIVSFREPRETALHVSLKFPINLGPPGTHVDDKLALSTPDRDANLFRPTWSL